MYNTNQNYGLNPYYNFIPQMPIQNYRTNSLQGKVIDNLDVVKGADIILDGSISYFPMADGSAIATKQLQQDGTSKIVIYKPVNEDENKVEYITKNDFDEKVKNLNNKDLKDIKEELKILKRQVEDITDDLKEKKGK